MPPSPPPAETCDPASPEHSENCGRQLVLVHVAQLVEYSYAAHATEQFAIWHAISAKMQWRHCAEYNAMVVHLDAAHANPDVVDCKKLYTHVPWHAPIWMTYVS